MNTTMDKIILAIFIPILAIFAYMILVMLPVLFYAESECLSHGYPKAHVTVGLERYCSNFDGAVTVRVTKQ